MVQDKKALLLLEDGTEFSGFSFGETGTIVGELSFLTSMIGFQEVATDPSSSDSLVVTANAHIGNYGITNDELESSKVYLSGVICNNYTQIFSRAKANDSLQDFLKDSGIIGIYGIDTRELIQYLRVNGGMYGVISSEETDKEVLLQKLLASKTKANTKRKFLSETSEVFEPQEGDVRYKVAAINLGLTMSAVRSLTDRGCQVKVFPSDSSYADLMEYRPDGIFLSNGPDNPKLLTNTIELVQQALKKDVPLFGIGLGHLILAEALGIDTLTSKYKHRGSNYPVQNLESGKGEITKRIYGYEINQNILLNSDKIVKTHQSLHDKSVEGFRVAGKKAFSVRYIPYTQDSWHLYDQFLSMMRA